MLRKYSDHAKKIVKSQRKNILDLSWLVVVQLTAAGFGFLTQVKIANTLGKELFGQIAFGTLLGMYGATLIQFGMDRTLTRDLVHYPKRTNILVHASLILRYILVFLFAIGILIWKLSSPRSEINWGIFLVALAVSLYALDLKPLYDAWKMFQRQSTYFLTQKALYLFSIWVLILAFPKDLSVFLVGVVMLVTVIFYLFQQHRWAIRRVQSSGVSWKKLISVTWWLFKKNWMIFLATMAGIITTRLNQLVLKHTSGYVELGSYAAAWQLVLVGNLFLDQISRIGNSATARNTKANVEYSIKLRFILKYSMVMLLVSLLFSIPMIFFGKFMFNLFFKPEYFSAVKLMPIFGIYLTIYSLGIVASQCVIHSRLEKEYLFSVSVGAMFSIVTCSHLIPTYGIWGAALSLLISHGVTMLLYVILLILDIKRVKTNQSV